MAKYRSNIRVSRSSIDHRNPVPIVWGCGKIIPILCANNHTPNILVGNLPYNSAARLLMLCTQRNIAPNIIATMVQKEIAERVLSAPGSKNYSSFSILMQLTYEHNAHWNVPRTVFYPSPQCRFYILNAVSKRGNRYIPHASDRIGSTMCISVQKSNAT